MSDTPAQHRRRSEFIRRLVQQSTRTTEINSRFEKGPPKTIVQFWHDLDRFPNDIEECISSWRRWAKCGFAHCLFDETTAKAFIAEELGRRYAATFDRCYHPAMQADYFRLCYLFIVGGAYIDADDVCVATEISWLFDDGRLKVQPLCYDVASDGMVAASDFLRTGAYESNWIFYVNNNPLIARARHPIVERALNRATELLESAGEGILPEIQETTGPGNLSKSIFELGTTSREVEHGLVVLKDWNSIAVSRWPLAHRSDSRNWRLSNQRAFRRGENGAE